jgi:hypothetical protein
MRIIGPAILDRDAAALAGLGSSIDRCRIDDTPLAVSRPHAYTVTMLGGYIWRGGERPSRDVLSLLTQRQHTNPHEPLAVTVETIINELNYCSSAIERVIRKLELDTLRPVGRLRRAELLQLGATIQRLCAGPPTGQPVVQTPPDAVFHAKNARSPASRCTAPVTAQNVLGCMTSGR